MDSIEDSLVSEVGLSVLQARVFLLITTDGAKTPDQISQILGISKSESLQAVKSLEDLGALISLPDARFEAMHPRFTAVNMYRRSCARRGIEFGRNKIVDSIGAALEARYDAARTKYSNPR